MERQKDDGRFAQESRSELSLGDNDRRIDESKDISKSILNDDLLTGSDGEVHYM